MATDARIEFAEFEKIAPEARAALTALSKAVGDSGLDKALTELIKIRASQINGCTFCVQFHLNLARKFGVPQTKLDLVAVWRDAGIFNAREMVALAWTEALTHVTPAGVADEDFAAARKVFDESELVFLTAAVASINAWNRIAMAFRFSPPIPQENASA
ncbi:AhpD family alkylhydroperoxidase [Edaphobacter aggregans]|uniref:AhpD family alkylhydroperoxidase n=1 Tax=Edaphobacter aggregans TaxID=570835 RepID=A0A3R9PSN9_9BACT|nr:carboxymuconolactone decarboxylase family protein [Edaphobacter aggregans]RSL17058.1 AhpD family alkylhydroperoxidase [Edaphobacter aggregans]